MNLNLSKKSIIKKTSVVAGLTLLSRFLGIAREMLMVRFFGVGIMSDAFIAAFKLPNFFRHIFAEGAMSASFVPAIVKSVKDGNRHEANGLMTISFLFFEGLVLLLYAFVLLKTDWVTYLVAPGFSPEQRACTIDFLRVLFSLLFFISSSALLAGALNAVNHFFMPAFATPLWNMVWVATLVICLAYKLPVAYVTAGIVLGGFIQFLGHLIVFFKYNFTFGGVDTGVKAAFKTVLQRFLPGVCGVGIVEFNLFVSGSIASFLPKGSMSLLYYASRFMNIPLGMFAVAFSSVMLSHFSRLVLYAPKRLSFYLLESAKLITWIIIPSMLSLIFVSRELFTDLLGSKGTPAIIHEGGIVLIIYTTGLLFLCINKILLSMLYALKDTTSTAFASGTCALVNVIADLVGIYFFASYGIAAANTLAALTMTIICLLLLHRVHDIKFYVSLYGSFFIRYILHLTIACCMFLFLRYALYALLSYLSCHYLVSGLGFWIAYGFLISSSWLLMYSTRHLFGTDAYFLKFS